MVNNKHRSNRKLEPIPLGSLETDHLDKDGTEVTSGTGESRELHPVPLQLLDSTHEAVSTLIRVVSNCGHQSNNDDKSLSFSLSFLKELRQFEQAYLNSIEKEDHSDADKESTNFEKDKTPFKRISRPLLWIKNDSVYGTGAYELCIETPNISFHIYDKNRELIKNGVDDLTIEDLREAFFKYGGTIEVRNNTFDYLAGDSLVTVVSEENVSMEWYIDPKDFNSIEDFLEFNLNES